MRSHYVPEFYLKEFATPTTRVSTNPRLWVYDMTYGKWRNRSPGQVCTQVGLYQVTLSGNRVDDGIEGHYSEIERGAAPVIKKLIANEHLDEINDLPKLACFLAAMFVRTPLAYDSLEAQMTSGESGVFEAYKKNPACYAHLRDSYRGATGRDLTDDVVERWCDPANSNLPVTRREVLISIYLSWLLISPRIATMAWTFHHTGMETEFITSDNPMQVHDPKRPFSVELADSGFKTFHGVCPLPQEVCWEGELSRSDIQYADCDKEKVAQLNTLQIWAADRYVIASTKEFPASDAIHHPRAG